MGSLTKEANELYKRLKPVSNGYVSPYSPILVEAGIVKGIKNSRSSGVNLVACTYALFFIRMEFTKYGIEKIEKSCELIKQKFKTLNVKMPTDMQDNLGGLASGAIPCNKFQLAPEQPKDPKPSESNLSAAAPAPPIIDSKMFDAACAQARAPSEDEPPTKKLKGLKAKLLERTKVS